MRIDDEGVIIHSKKIEEKSLFVTLLSKEHGIISGFAKNILGNKKNLSLYQLGNQVHFSWFSRTSSLGAISCELIHGNSILFNFKDSLKILEKTSVFLKDLLPERDPHSSVLYPEFLLFLEQITSLNIQNLSPDNKILLEIFYIRMLLLILAECGIVFNFQKCHISDIDITLHQDAFISPKTGATVCKEIGKDYIDRLFPVPGLLFQMKNGIAKEKYPLSNLNLLELSKNDISFCYEIIQFFLEKSYSSVGKKYISI